MNDWSRVMTCILFEVTDDCLSEYSFKALGNSRSNWHISICSIAKATVCSRMAVHPNQLYRHWIRNTRANVLAEIRDASTVLELRLRNDKSRADQSIKEWILCGPKVGKESSPQQQLREYAQSQEIERWKKDGYTITPILVVVVGSRHVLLWNFDGDTLDASPRLALK